MNTNENQLQRPDRFEKPVRSMPMFGKPNRFWKSIRLSESIRFLLVLLIFSQCRLPGSHQELHGLWMGTSIEFMPHNIPLPVLNEYREDGTVTTKRLGQEEKVYSWSLSANTLRVDTLDYKLLALSKDTLLTANNYRFLFRRVADAPIEKTKEELREYIENASWAGESQTFHFDIEKVITEKKDEVSVRCWNIEKYGDYAFLYQNGYWENCNVRQAGQAMQITKAADGQLEFSVWNETGKYDLACTKLEQQANFEALKKQRTFHQCNFYGRRLSHHVGKTYEGGGKAIERHFYNNYKVPETAKTQNGFITLRFLVNCEGEPGAYELLGMDENFKPYNFHSDISEQLLELTKQLTEWTPIESDGQAYDGYKIINFNIQNGAIHAISL